MTWALQVSEGERIGTGAAISARVVLTCEHVVRGLDAVNVRHQFGSQIRCKVLELDARLDVALLEPMAAKDVFSDDVVLVPRALWRGTRPERDRAQVELCTDEPETMRSLRVALRHAPHSARRVQ